MRGPNGNSWKLLGSFKPCKLSINYSCYGSYALYCSLYKHNCKCAVTTFLPAKNLQWVKKEQLNFCKDQQKVFGISYISNQYRGLNRLPTSQIGQTNHSHFGFYVLMWRNKYACIVQGITSV